MKVALSADHAGFSLKQHLVKFLTAQGHEVIDLGVDTDAVPSDYPDAAERVGAAVRDDRAERGILVCGSGVGACIAANKMTGVYASICHDTYSAHQGVEHDRMNVLCLGGRIVGPSVAEELAIAFLQAQPSTEERHQRRFGKIVTIEERERKG
ncbi:MAG: RpiB/LacA/LacB family sugar-phosphate isomerase [Chloroflexota bacterium]|nr:RpiB/LacA/LacB family sugar-phosphate isomerase [Chloroflexota bacterium]